MGRFATALLAGTADLELVRSLGRGDDVRAELARAEADLGLDLTVAGRGFEHAVWMLEAGLRPVVGTSGVTPEETAALDRLARERALGGLVVPNFSLGMLLLQRAAADLAVHLPAAAIVEHHHAGKRDAPSSTALETARTLASARAARGLAPPAPEGAPACHVEAGVPIHAVRLPGSYAHQEVLLSGPGEVLTLRHDMLGPEAFGPGLLAALRHAARATGVARGLGAVLFAVGGEAAGA